jgi:hypothetical protein
VNQVETSLNVVHLLIGWQICQPVFKIALSTGPTKGESNSFKKGGKKGSNVGVLPMFFDA